MIKANHSNFADLIFKYYIFRLLKKNFNSINLIGNMPKVQNDAPLIIAPNHSTWWDGFFVYLINKLFFQRKFYIMIIEEQLSNYKFFTKLGGFSINKNSPKDIVRSLKYISEQMQNSRNSVITIFPQGELLPNFIRPLDFNKGIDKIIEFYGENVQVLPLSIRIEYLKEEKPVVFFKFGEILNSKEGDSGFVNIINQQVTNNLELIGKNIIEDNLGKIIFDGKKSVSEKSKKIFEPVNRIKNGIS